jgi:hypothetical protein
VHFESLVRPQNFIPKLKDHLLPRIRATLLQESHTADHGDTPQGSMQGDLPNARSDRDCIYFQSDRIYKHHLLRINFTTYDVRRSQDIINPGTHRRDIMLLADDYDAQSDQSHPFLYARVIGVYHVNVIYAGSGMLDYTARRFDFAWVRWFQHDAPPSHWSDYMLDSLSFPPMADEHSFGFVDPLEILRGCHIVPRPFMGKRRADDIPISKCANDANDWRAYYVNRCGIVSP